MQCHSDYFSVARVSVWVCMDIGVSTCELARGKVMTGMRQVRWHCQLQLLHSTFQCHKYLSYEIVKVVSAEFSILSVDAANI